MANISKQSVLYALLTLAGRKADGGPRVITAAAIAKQTGKPGAAVKAVLAANAEALAFDDAGRTVGAKPVSLACCRGLVVHVTDRVSGTRYLRSFRECGTVRQTYSLDSNDETRSAQVFEASLNQSGKVVCRKPADLPASVLTRVWQEDGLLDT